MPWDKSVKWIRLYPVWGPRLDTVKWLTIERMLMLLELKELKTGRKARKHAWEHKKAVWAAYRARAAIPEEGLEYA